MDKNFDVIWNLYPRRIGKKAAVRYYKASVKTEQDYFNMLQALENYLKSDTVKKGFIQNGSTWFNNWKDWIDYTDIKRNEAPKSICALCKTIFGERETRYVHDDKKICGKCDMKLTRERLQKA